MSCTICIPTFHRKEQIGNLLSSLVGILPDERISDVLIAVTGNRNESLGQTADSLIRAISLSGIPCTVKDGFSDVLSAKEWFKEQSKADILLLLDDDVVIGKGYLNLLNNFSDTEIGAVSGSLQTPIDFSGHYRDYSYNPINNPPSDTLCNRIVIENDGLLSLKNKYQVYMLKKPARYDCEVLVGTAMFVRRELLEIDMAFLEGKCYFEEFDYTYNIKTKGYRLIYDSSEVAWHLRGKEGGMRGLGERNKSHKMVSAEIFRKKYGL